MDLQTYLILGGYGFSSLIGGFMWRELKGMRRELKDGQAALTREMSDLKLEMTRETALRIGQDHEARITRLERAMINSAKLRDEDV